MFLRVLKQLVDFVVGWRQACSEIKGRAVHIVHAGYRQAGTPPIGGTAKDRCAYGLGVCFPGYLVWGSSKGKLKVSHSLDHKTHPI